MNYGFSRVVPFTYEKAVERVTEELQREGFGVLTSIDVQATLKKKLNADFSKYVILGACNPSLAYKALQIEEQIGLLLPCNVIVYERGQSTVVAAFDPMMMITVVEREDLRPIAEEVKRKLERVVAAI